MQGVTGPRLSVSAARGLCYGVKLMLGLATGMYILTYLADMGSITAAALGFTGQNLSLYAQFIGLAALAFCFLVEYIIDVPSGAEAQVRGTRNTFLISFGLRAGFMFLLAPFALRLTSDPTILISGIVLMMAVFAVAYTLFVANSDQWLASHCADTRTATKAFAIADVFLYGGLILGAAIAVLLPAGQSYWGYVGGGGLCILTAVICLAIPGRDAEVGNNITPDDHSVRTRKEVKKRAFGSLAGLPHLNKSFWVTALAYGVSQVFDAVIPLIYLLTNNNETDLSPILRKLLILVVCLWLPYLIGALSLLPTRLRAMRTKVDTTAKEPEAVTPEVVGGMLATSRRAMLVFCGCVVAIAVVASLPFTGLWQDLLFGLLIFLTKMSQGRLFPLLGTFNSRVANDHPTRDVAKTLLAIGERRKKLAAMATLIVPTVSALLAANGVLGQTLPVLFWSLGLLGVVLAVVGVIALRRAVADQLRADQDIPIPGEAASSV